MDAGGDPIDLRPVGAGSVGAVTTRDLLRKSRFAADAALVRAAAFDRCGGFDEGLTSSEDWDMWIRISCTFSLRKIGARLVNVRVHSGSMSSDAARMNRNMTAVLKKARLAGVEPSAPLRFWDAVFAFKDYQVAWIANGEGEPGKAIGLLLRSIFRHLYFSDHRSLENPRFFRLRALRSFLANALFRGGR
jgi:hypothetical protein